MKIKEIHFHNFRCFKDFEIKLGASVTVFIGKNGSGKSNVLAGLTKALSFMFSRDYKFEGYRFPGDSYVKKASFSTMDANRDMDTGDFNYPIEINCKAQLKGESIDWSMVIGSKKGKVQSSFYKESLKQVIELYNKKGEEMPLLAFFSDSYPHRKKNLSTYARKIINAREVIPRNFAYYDWDSESNCVDIWHKRYINCYRRVNDFKIGISALTSEISNLLVKHAKAQNEFDLSNSLTNELVLKRKWLAEVTSLKSEILFIDKFLKKFTENSISKNITESSFELKELVVDQSEGLTASLDFHFSDNRKILFDSLPMGFKRVLSIVFEIAYRSYILNHEAEPAGIVIIDEIELHLHPSLASEIITRLRNTFPQIQFIITTHSPHVITSIKNDNAHHLTGLSYFDGNYQKTEFDNYFGADLETTLSMVMQTDFRDSVLENMLESYRTFKKYNLLEEALKMAKKIKEYAGEDNIYVNSEVEKAGNVL